MKNKKARDSQGLFVTEGTKLFLESPRDRIVQVLVTKEYEREHPEVLHEIPQDCAILKDMEESRFASVCDTKSPQGILTVIRKPPVTRLDPEQSRDRGIIGSFGKDPFFIVLENLQDPGNAGTILRTGEAAGVTAVFLTEGSVDLYSPKTIRSTMGSIFRVPHFYVKDAPSLLRALRKIYGVTKVQSSSAMRADRQQDIPGNERCRNCSGPEESKSQPDRKPGNGEPDGTGTLMSYAAHLRGDRSYTACDFTKGTVLVIGNEGNGISDRTADACDVLMKIPMEGKVESLNAAMAAGILMYEVRRQRTIK